jgi:hypothetical protein
MKMGNGPGSRGLRREPKGIARGGRIPEEPPAAAGRKAGRGKESGKEGGER